MLLPRNPLVDGRSYVMRNLFLFVELFLTGYNKTYTLQLCMPKGD